MKTAARSACVAVLLLVLAATAPPAAAKGPTDVTVSGPGIDTRLTSTRAADDVDLDTLGEAARLYDVLGTEALASAPDLTRDELGPRYILTWTVGDAELIMQHAYPFADGGAWVRFLPTDSGWGTGATGWARTPALTEQIAALGEMPEQPSRQRPVVTSTGETAAPAGPTESEQSAGPRYDVLVPAGLVLVGVLGAGALVLRRRRLSS